MNLTEATIKALQGKLTESLDFEVGGHWSYNKDEEKALIEKHIEEIKATNKPIKYGYIKGYSNWVADYVVETLKPEELYNLFNNGHEYRVREKSDCVEIERIENRW